MLLASFVLLLASSACSAITFPDCKQDGLCSGIVVGTASADSYNACLDLCASNEFCGWIFFLEDASECVQMLDCPTVDAGRTGGLSSQVDCPRDDQEQDPAGCAAWAGACQGRLVEADVAPTFSDCRGMCREVEGCDAFTWYSDTSSCVMVDGCWLTDDACENCFRGGRDCKEDEEDGWEDQDFKGNDDDYTLQRGVTALTSMKLFVAGGGAPDLPTELIDLADPRSACPLLSPLPARQAGGVGMYMAGDGVLVCGRYGAAERECYAHDVTLDEWTRAEGFQTKFHSGATAVYLQDTMWFVTEDVSTNSWLYDTATEEWTDLPKMPEATGGTQAGLVTYADGRREVVVVAGRDTAATQLLSLDTMTWRYGPDFPSGKLHLASTVSVGDTFLVVGGLVDVEGGMGAMDNLDGMDFRGGMGRQGGQDAIFVFNVAAQQWDRLAQTLAFPRHSFAALLVPADYAECY